jgi:hypothetical protein
MPVRPFHSLVYEQRRRHLTTFQNLCVDPLSRAIRHGSVRGPHTSAEREQRGASQCSNPTRHRPVANESNHPNPNCACNLQRHLQARPSNGGPPLRPTEHTVRMGPTTGWRERGPPCPLRWAWIGRALLPRAPANLGSEKHGSCTDDTHGRFQQFACFTFSCSTLSASGRTRLGARGAAGSGEAY